MTVDKTNPIREVGLKMTELPSDDKDPTDDLDELGLDEFINEDQSKQFDPNDDGESGFDGRHYEHPGYGLPPTIAQKADEADDEADEDDEGAEEKADQGDVKYVKDSLSAPDEC